MAKKEKPIADSETGKIKVKAKKEKQPDGNETKGNVTKVKEKMKMKPIIEEETITKVDLSKPIEPKSNETKEETTENNTNNEGVVTELKDAEPVQKQEEVQPKTETQEDSVLEEITSDSTDKKVEEVEKVVEQAIVEAEHTGKPVPENVEKLLFFMEETGGDINDYVTLNQDYSKLDNHTLLKEYYSSTKPHLSSEEVDFVMEDTFAYDEEVDDEKDIKRKKLAMKEQVAQAQQHLESVTSKYS